MNYFTLLFALSAIFLIISIFMFVTWYRNEVERIHPYKRTTPRKHTLKSKSFRKSSILVLVVCAMMIILIYKTI